MGHGCSAHYDNTHRGFVHHAQKAGMVLLICLGVWVMTGFAGVWPLWVAMFLGVKLAMHARRTYTASLDDDEPEADAPAAEDDFVIV